MAANNQGIVHLKLAEARGFFPAQLACKRTNAHMAVSADRFDAEPMKCKAVRNHMAGHESPPSEEMRMMKQPTEKQIACLRQALEDGDALEIGGMEGRKINRRVWGACIERGWLDVDHWVEPYAPFIALKLTDDGRAILSRGSTLKTDS